MIVYGAAILGACVGALTAKRRGGNLLDLLQYGFGFGVFFGITAFLAVIIAVRFAV